MKLKAKLYDLLVDRFGFTSVKCTRCLGAGCAGTIGNLRTCRKCGGVGYTLKYRRA